MRGAQDTPSAPPQLLAAAELLRASAELTSLLVASPYLSRAPRGDGHDVMVLPGFACSETSTFPLRCYLNLLGYTVHDWGLGRNLGSRTVGRDDARLAERIAEISQDVPGPVSLVGHSLGGVMARRYAISSPDSVRQVICLGSPFVGHPSAVNPLVAKLHDRISGDPAPPPPQPRPQGLSVPFTAIFSATDGVVSPSDCTEDPSERAENIEVFGSHCGLIVHPAVFYAVADRLAQPMGEWRPFQPRGLSGGFYGDGSLSDKARAA